MLYSLFLRGSCLAAVLALAATTLAAEPEKRRRPASTSSASLGLRFDCPHDFSRGKGAAQPCISVSGLRIRIDHKLSEKVRAFVRIDPLGTPIESMEESPWRDSLPSVRNTKLLVVDDYAVIWTARENLDVALESLGGNAQIPSLSGLSMGGLLSDTGWNQTALTLTYFLPALQGINVKIAVGNGEGESAEGMSAQKYAGITLTGRPLAGTFMNVGYSRDGNNANSDAYKWRYSKMTNPPLNPTMAFSTERLGVGLGLDGHFPGVRGLAVGFGYQRTVAKDLDPTKKSVPTFMEQAASGPVDPQFLLLQNPTSTDPNRITRNVFGFNVSYKILDTYFLGADYQSMSLDTGSVRVFQPCKAPTNTTCAVTDTDGDPRNNLTKSVYTVGGGIGIANATMLTFEYSHAALDKTYTGIYYPSADGSDGSNEWEGFNARLAYNWK